MRNLEKHRKYLFLLAMLFLFSFQIIKAQPTCSSNFDPYQACQWNVQDKEYVFLGKVISILEKTGNAHSDPQKILVEVEKPIKGSLSPQIEIFIDRFCYGEIYENRKYIFTARQVNRDKFSGLFSEKWSSAIDERYSENDIKEIIQEIRSAINKIKQPSFVGAVVEQVWSVGRYMIASRGIKKQFSPDYLRPLPNVIVTAKGKDGQIFTSSTNAGGEFVFENLPPGIYEIYTNLPKEYNVRSEALSLFQENDKTFLKIRDQLCSQRITINAQIQGKLTVRIKLASNEKDSMVLSLWRVVSDKKNREIVEFYYAAPKERILAKDRNGYDLIHTFDNVPVGNYVLMMSVQESTLWANGQFFYPATNELEKAEIVNIKAGKTSNIIFQMQE